MAHRILSLFGASCGVVNLHPPGIRFTIMLNNAPPAGLRALPEENFDRSAALTCAL
jgi:hypothetical protein